MVTAAQHKETDPLIRFSFRDGYKYNYLYDTVVLSLVRANAQEEITSSDSPASYLEKVRNVLYDSVLFSHGMVILFLLFLIFRTRDKNLQFAYFAALALSYAGFILEYFHLFPNVPYRIINSDLTDSMKNPLLSFIHPGLGFGLFYTNARNTAILLATGVFLLRWNGKVSGSYWLVVFLALVHTTSASLLLILLVGLDYIQQSEILKRKRIILPIIAVVLIGGAQSLVWQEVGAGMSLFAMLPLGVFLLIPLEKRIQTLRNILKINSTLPQNRPYWDASLLSLFLFLVFLILWLFFYSTGHSTEYRYTLSELPIRLLSLLRFPMLKRAVLPL